MQVFGEGVIVVACRWLAGFAKPSAIVGDDTLTAGQKSRELLLPGGPAQWISVDKDYGVTRAMVFVVEIDVTGVFFADINVWLGDSPFKELRRLATSWAG
jgi:hypothetical protein